MIEEVVNAADLARLFGVQVSTVARLAKSGVVVKIAPGLFDAEKSIRGYVDHLREIAAGRLEGGDAKAASLQSGALLRDAQRELTEVRIAAERRELLPKAFAFGLIERIVGGLRAAFLEIPAAAASRLNLSNADHDALENLIDEKLNELAEADFVVRTLDELGIPHSLMPMTRARFEAESAQ